MNKKITALLFASVLVLSASRAFAVPDDDDDFTPVTKPVPESASSVLLLGCALTGLAGMGFFFRKKDVKPK